MTNAKNKNEKTALMRQLQAAGLAAHETALYLDCHPFNRKALDYYRAQTEKYAELKARYEASFGPLSVESGAVGDSGWRWINGWEWQNHNVEVRR